MCKEHSVVLSNTFNFSTPCSQNIIVLCSNLDFLLILILFLKTGELHLTGNIFEDRILGFFPLLLIRILKWYLHKMREYSKNEENMFDGDIYNI